MKKWLTLCGFLAAGLLSAPAYAATVGNTVSSIGSTSGVGTTEYRPMLGGEAIKYFIPLTSGGSCVYGAGCGVAMDSGYGGKQMSMFLFFDGVSTTAASTLNIIFEDLDLWGVNDPDWFRETLEIFDAAGNSLTGFLDNISSPYVSGNHDTQQLLSLDLGILDTAAYYLELRFTADSDYNAWNTPEYLIAEISSVPLPASSLLLLGGLAGLGAMARRKRAKV